MSKQRRIPIVLFLGVVPLPKNGEERAVLKNIIELHEHLKSMRVQNPIEYYGCCANFHTFVISAITRHNRGRGTLTPEVRVVGWKKGDWRQEIDTKYQIVFEHPAGAQEMFLVSECCLRNSTILPAAERRYQPCAA